MAAMPAARIGRAASMLPSTASVFPFLAPSVQSVRAPPTAAAQFSTSAALYKRDNNRNRGISALRHTGPRKRQTLSVKSYPLPKPVEPESKIAGDANHGLWAFFPESKKLFRTPVEISQHGRAWEVHELRRYNHLALHKLWWLCVKERNRLATEKLERKRLKAEFGDAENQTRDDALQGTMKAILDTMVERQAAWKDARKIARQRPDIDLSRKEQQWIQNPYDADDLYAESNGVEQAQYGSVVDEVTEEERLKLEEVKQARATAQETQPDMPPNTLASQTQASPTQKTI